MKTGAVVLMALCVAGCRQAARPSSPRWLSGTQPTFGHRPGFGPVARQRELAVHGVVGRLVRKKSRLGSSDLFLVGEAWDTPVRIDAEQLKYVQLGTEYRFFGHLVGGGHKGLIVHVKILAAQEVACQQGAPRRAEDRAP
jgi:hypothetical protein